MKELSLENTGNGVYIISNLSLKRLKKIPKTSKISDEEFKNGYLETLDFDKLYKKELVKIHKKDKNLHALIKPKNILGCRVCFFKEKYGKEWIESVRFELVYDCNTSIKVSELLYLSCKNILEVKYSNY